MLAAYKELLPAGQFPLGVLNLEVPSEHLLINTSPDKSRVKLLRPEAILSFVSQVVQGLLSAHPLARALPEPTPLTGPSPVQRAHFPHLRYLGSFCKLYLLAESKDELYVVDQHAAHERIFYEELSRRYREEPPLELPHPELFSLSLGEELSLAERLEDLEQAGLQIEPFGPGKYRARTIPAFLAGYPSLVGEVVKSSLGASSFAAAWRTVLAHLACLPAIKAGHPLSSASAQALLDALAGCELPWACPHGRPTLLVLSKAELARRFGRRSVRAVVEPSSSRKQITLQQPTADQVMRGKNPKLVVLSTHPAIMESTLELLGSERITSKANLFVHNNIDLPGFNTTEPNAQPGWEIEFSEQIGKLLKVTVEVHSKPPQTEVTTVLQYSGNGCAFYSVLRATPGPMAVSDLPPGRACCPRPCSRTRPYQ